MRRMTTVGFTSSWGKDPWHMRGPDLLGRWLGMHNPWIRKESVIVKRLLHRSQLY